jgi:transcriptional regulator with XRE-family HTH domain
METMARRLGAELRQARAQAGWTIAEVARELGWTVTKVRRVEKRGMPGLDELAVMCRLYRLDLRLLHERLMDRDSSHLRSDAAGACLGRPRRRDESGAVVVGASTAGAPDAGSSLESGPTAAASGATVRGATVGAGPERP